MSRGWEEQVAVITGAASGLGSAVAKKLHSFGTETYLLDCNEEALSSCCRAMGAGATAIPLDVTREDEVEEAIRSVVEASGGLDVLVNCAGIVGRTNLPSHEVDLEDFRRVMEVNLVGSFLTAKFALPVMVERGYGRVLHIASIAGKEGNAGMLAYSTSKAAVIGMTKVQGKEYAETGVTINALAPAVIRTPMVEAMPTEQVTYMTDKIPMKRCGTLEEVAEIVSFIVSPEASFTTGFIFDLSGGRAVY